jgi:hypothetical protein
MRFSMTQFAATLPGTTTARAQDSVSVCFSPDRQIEVRIIPADGSPGYEIGYKAIPDKKFMAGAG